jgi:signal transduction histidine kinase
MSFQWLQMRITEEQDRRERENNILNRLPSALDELRTALASCLESYNAAFDDGRATLETAEGAIHVTAGEARVRVCLDPLLPGFQVDQGSDRMAIEVGILPGGNLFFRDEEKYITLEDMTRRILDRALFPKLKD